MIKICIIPAAGKGTRWAPVSGYLPKEMLPLIDKPVIEWVINEAIDSGCKHIIVVINKQKEMIREYLSHNKKLSAKAKFSFVYQKEALGIAHTMHICKNLVKDEPFVVALPDLPTISKTPVIKQLVKLFERERGKTHIVSFDKFSSDSLHLYGECLAKLKKNGVLEIIHYCEKANGENKPHHYGNNLRMSGRFVFSSKIFPIINKLLKERTQGEISDRTALRSAMVNNQETLGCVISGHTYDTGYPNGYVKANTAFFKKLLQKRVLT